MEEYERMLGICCSSAHDLLVLGVLKLCTARRVQLLFGRTFLALTVKSFNLSRFYRIETNKSVHVFHVFYVVQLSFGLGMF